MSPGIKKIYLESIGILKQRKNFERIDLQFVRDYATGRYMFESVPLKPTDSEIIKGIHDFVNELAITLNLPEIQPKNI